MVISSDAQSLAPDADGIASGRELASYSNVNIETEKVSDSNAVIEKVITVVFLLSFLCILAYQIGDPDVFWHIKTGEWIWQHEALPDKDPFSYTVDDSVYNSYIRPSVILRQYWVSQLALYGLHSAFGLFGIVLFRFLIYAPLLGLMFFWMRKSGVHQMSALFFLLPLLLVLFVYGGERPNTLSYLLAAVIFYLVDEFVRSGGKKGVLIPFIMVVWSLMHGGFLIGEVLLSIYLSVMLFRGLRGSVIDKSYVYKVAVLAFSIAAPFAFFRGAWNTVEMMIYETSGPLATLYKNTIAETVSPFTHAGANLDLFAFFAFMILLLIVVIRRFSIEHVVLAVFFLAISFTAIRYLPFFLILVSPILAIHWSARPSFDLGNKVFRYSLYATILFCTVFMGQAGFRKSFFLNGMVSDYYPGDAVSFMGKVKPEGNMFNSYTWGGYLIYSLYPDRKVFIDPRAVSLPLYAKYREVVDVTTKNPRKIWSDVFREYRISVVIIPYKENGKLTMLTKKLVEDPEWSLVFVGDESTALIFLKNEPCNDQQIKRYSLRKELVYEKALENLKKDPAIKDKWRNDLQLAVVSIFLKRYGESERFLEKAVKSNRGLSETSVSKVLTILKKGEYASLDDEELYKIWKM